MPTFVECKQSIGLTNEQTAKVETSVEKLCEGWGISRTLFDEVTKTIFEIIDKIGTKDRELSMNERERETINGLLLIDTRGREDLKNRSDSVELKFMMAQKEVDDLTAVLVSLTDTASAAELERNKASGAYYAAKEGRDNRPSSKVKTRLNAVLPGLMQAKSRTSTEYELAIKSVKLGREALAKAKSHLADLQKEKERVQEALGTTNCNEEFIRALTIIEKRWVEIVVQKNGLQQLVDATINQFIDKHITIDKEERRLDITATLQNISDCRNKYMQTHSLG